MNRRDMSALVPVMQGLSALRDMVDGKEFKAAIDEMATTEKSLRKAAKQAKEATAEREAATRECEQATAEMERASAKFQKQEHDIALAKQTLAQEKADLDEFRTKELGRLKEWEQRLASQPDKTKQLDKKILQAERREARAAELEARYEARLEELGLKPAA